MAVAKMSALGCLLYRLSISIYVPPYLYTTTTSIVHPYPYISISSICTVCATFALLSCLVLTRHRYTALLST